MRNTLLGSERTDYLLCVGYDTLRIQETEIKNSDSKTKNIKYKNITMSNSFGERDGETCFQ